MGLYTDPYDTGLNLPQNQQQAPSGNTSFTTPLFQPFNPNTQAQTGALAGNQYNSTSGQNQTPSSGTSGNRGGYGFLPGGGTAAPGTTYAPSNSASPFRNDVSGYNPLQYATDAAAQRLAGTYGGTVVSSGPSAGPMNVPAQNLIQQTTASGNTENFNAGLLQDLINKYGAAEAAKMHAAELNYVPPGYNPATNSFANNNLPGQGTANQTTAPATNTTSSGTTTSTPATPTNYATPDIFPNFNYTPSGHFGSRSYFPLAQQFPSTLPQPGYNSLFGSLNPFLFGGYGGYGGTGLNPLSYGYGPYGQGPPQTSAPTRSPYSILNPSFF